MENTKKGAKPTLGRSIQGAALIVQAPARIAGSSRRLSTTARDADIAEIRDRLDRIANDLAALEKDMANLKSRLPRPRKRRRVDANQLELAFDTCSSSAEQPIKARKSP
jgi:hypothetical protein